MTKILITGGSGVIGSMLTKYFYKNNQDVHYTFLTNNPSYHNGHKLDITKNEETKKLIEEIKADVVIHTIALTSVDLCETNQQLAESINVIGTRNIVEACKLTGSKITFISTSSVFNGEKNEYSENDLESPISNYGLTKLKAEKIVKESGLPYLILRTDQPYCWIEKWQHTNSVIRVLQTLKLGKIMREIVDWYNTPTYVSDFVRATDLLLAKDATGTYHVIGSDYVNRYEWSLLIADVFGLNKQMIVPITSATLNLPAKRSNVNLSNKKLFYETKIRMRGIREGLINMKETIETDFFSEV